MSLLETVLAMCGLNTQTSQEVKGVLEWVEQQAGPAIYSKKVYP
ncbi:hypothetical protein [Pantoea vagans]|nr:hypothetical protein [Pantoea vagans]